MFDYTRVFDPAQQPDNVYCIILQVGQGERLYLTTQLTPDRFELAICVYLAGTRVGVTANLGHAGRPVSWTSPINTTATNQTYYVAGFWKDQPGGSWPWYAATLIQTGGGGKGWDGQFHHKQPGIFDDNVGAVNLAVR
jgi:hypothetical protein